MVSVVVISLLQASRLKFSPTAKPRNRFLHTMPLLYSLVLFWMLCGYQVLPPTRYRRSIITSIVLQVLSPLQVSLKQVSLLTLESMITPHKPPGGEKGRHL